ncbi:D-mannonate oxidoreductase [Thioclava sp. SK-1]|nr:D-mannonate oxidoreductase [Thioclava sp. SK-1]
MRLTSLAQVPQNMRPGYMPDDHGVGIVHLGLGAFHKAHQAALTDRALAAAGGDWRILGVSLRSATAAAQLQPQNGLYTLMAKGVEGTSTKVIGAVADAICAAQDPEPTLVAMASPHTKIVSLTVTEKAYGLDRAAKGCDWTHPSVAADLQTPHAPHGVLGLIVEALRRRRAEKLAPFTVLCCDNLPDNGVLLRGAVIAFADRIDRDLSAWIAAQVAFPSTMVDRITPAATQASLTQAAALIGADDHAAVETESFCQWVIEDNFPQGRPAWEAAGVIFTDDVAAFEAMKLRMLNGSHSMLAYAGFHAGLAYVRDVMADVDLSVLVRRHLRAAAATLPRIPGMDLAQYGAALAQRFENPAIAHETFQIAMDGTEKMPQRIFGAAIAARKAGSDTRPFAFATAAWMRHISGSTHDCAAYVLRDPCASELMALAHGKTAKAIARAVQTHQIVPQHLSQDQKFWDVAEGILDDMLCYPMAVVLANEASGLPAS